MEEYKSRIHTLINSNVEDSVESHPANLMKRFDIVFGAWPDQGEWGGGAIRIGLKPLYGATDASIPPERGKRWTVICLQNESEAFAIRDWMAAGCPTMTIKVDNQLFALDSLEDWNGKDGEMPRRRQVAHMQNYRSDQWKRKLA
jgi:hypothetical protein